MTTISIYDIPIDCLNPLILDTSIIALSRTCKHFYNHYKEYVKSKYSNTVEILTSGDLNYIQFIIEYNIILFNQETAERLITLIVSYFIRIEQYSKELLIKLKNDTLMEYTYLWNWIVSDEKINKYMNCIDREKSIKILSFDPNFIVGFIQCFSYLTTDVQQFIILDINQVYSNSIEIIKKLDFTPSLGLFRLVCKKANEELLDCLLDKVSDKSLQSIYFPFEFIATLNLKIIKKLFQKFSERPSIVSLRLFTTIIINSYNIYSIQFIKENNYFNVTYFDFDQVIDFTIKSRDFNLAKELVFFIKKKYKKSSFQLKDYIEEKICLELIKRNDVELMKAFFGEFDSWDKNLTSSLIEYLNNTNYNKNSKRTCNEENLKRNQSKKLKTSFLVLNN